MPDSHRSRSSYIGDSGSDSDSDNITGYKSRTSHHQPSSSHVSSHSRSHHPRSHVSGRSSYSHASEHSSYSHRPESHVSVRSSRPHSQQSHAGSHRSSRHHRSAHISDDSDNDDDGTSTILPDDSASMMFMPSHTFRKWPANKPSQDRDIDELASRMSGSHISRHSSKNSHASHDDAVAAAWDEEETERARGLSYVRLSRPRSPVSSGRGGGYGHAGRDDSDEFSGGEDSRSHASPRSARHSYVSGSSRRTTSSSIPSSAYSGSTREYNEPRGKALPKPVRRGTVRQFETGDSRGTVLRKRDDGRMEWKRSSREGPRSDSSAQKWLQFFTT